MIESSAVKKQKTSAATPIGVSSMGWGPSSDYSLVGTWCGTAVLSVELLHEVLKGISLNLDDGQQ